ncbi:hypothetical protein [Alienimonas sp. DA493]|uniref:hypothetical protein n=1 Tax=Alienimonas sp. DA493 TaxID=3373605 RepID=UPI003754D7F9
MRLALAAGRLDVDNVADELTPRQAAEWRAYDAVCGLPDRRQDNRIAFGLARLGEVLGGGEMSPEYFRLPAVSDPPKEAPDSDDPKDFDHAAFARRTGSRLNPAR